MKPLAEDTPIEVERIQMEMVRQLTPAQKLSNLPGLTASPGFFDDSPLVFQGEPASARERPHFGHRLGEQRGSLAGSGF
jgi:hypothetical protein